MRERYHRPRPGHPEPGPRDDYGQADYGTDYGYDPATRTGYRTADAFSDRRDFGQADYSGDYAYDPVARQGYRRLDEPRGDPHDDDLRHRRDYEARHGEPRSWNNDQGRHGRRGPSDSVIWTVVVQRLDNERGLDASDIHVIVEGGEVTLNGTVRDRDDKRRAEDLAELRDVRHVQNNLRVREGWRRRLGF